MTKRRIMLVTPYVNEEFYQGIAAYIRIRRNWRVDLLSREGDTTAPVRKWPHDGVIVQLFSSRLLNQIREARRPAVNVSDYRPDWPLPTVHHDNRAIGRIAAKHFLERGFRHLAFVGNPTAGYAVQRREGFAATARENGIESAVLGVAGNDFGDREEVTQRILKWISSLPKPLGLAASNDGVARHITEACIDNGIAVPEEVAILGVDNSAIACNMVEVSISSVIPDWQRMGYEAAAMLDRMIDRPAKPPPRSMLIQPMGVATRQSSDIIAVNNTEVAAAVRFIREHLKEPIAVENVLDAVHVSRRWLEQRFRETLGRSIMDEVVRVRVERAQELLYSTDLAMPQIAVAAGFTDQNHMGRWFVRALHTSPTAFRKQHRAWQ